ncbi:hypothetical protein ACFW6F_22780 [Streptomyces sp. NPDC058746]|uniref:hypothetical protein n=1 Tax=Streptomyces sp. NPDC058746 TaxID=3346622 RepID=UPI0036AA73DE
MYKTPAPPVGAPAPRAADRAPDAPLDPGADALPLWLERVVHREFPAGSGRIDDAFSARHFTDVAGAYGRDYRPDLAPSGAGNTFAAMSRALVESAGLDREPVGVAIAAHATPDLDCRYAAATYLSEAWPHGPLSFGVSEQGTAAPFAALRLAAAYVKRGGLRKALVLVLDQATLPYETGAGLGGDAGAALLLSAQPVAGAARPLVRHTPGVAVEDVRSLLAGQLAPFGPDVLVAAGPGIDPGRDLPAGTGAVRETGKGFPCTALWAAHAAHVAGPDAGRPLVLVDHDPVSGDLGVCVTGAVTGAVDGAGERPR